MRTGFFCVLMAVAMVAFAHVPPYVPYQGLLADPDGNPVPDSTYTIQFSIWHDQTGGQAVWIEPHVVETYGGMFTVYLGTINPLTAEIFTVTSVDTSWLQLQVIGDTPMSPRMMIGTSPTSMFTSRISGDIFTEPGRLEVPGDNTAEFSLLVGDEQTPIIDIAADSTGGVISLADPRPTPLFPDVIVRSDLTGGSVSLADPRPTPLFPDVTIKGDSTGGTISLADPRPTPIFQDIEIHNGINGILIALNGPEQTPSVPGLFLSADAEGSQIIFRDAQTQNEMVSLGAFTSGGTIEIKSSAGITEWKVEEGESVVYDTSSLGKTVTHSGGIDVYDVSGELAAFCDTSGVMAPKGNIGAGNTICGTTTIVVGTGNTVTGDYSSVPGGRGNAATGDYSLAAGRYARARHQGSFVWADATGDSLVTNTNNQFLCRASGGAKIFSNSTMTRGVWLYPGTSQWLSISGRDSKQNIRPVDGEEILDKIKQLPISRWSYRDQDANVEHIGPMAEDFNSLFGIGDDDRSIAMLDPSGVALAGVKELIQENNELKRMISRLENRVAELEKQLR